MQVSQHCFSLQKKTSGGIINVGSPTALIYTGGIHMDNNSLSHTKWNCKYHIVFAPKYRRKVAYGKMKQDIANILSMLCKTPVYNFINDRLVDKSTVLKPLS